MNGRSRVATMIMLGGLAAALDAGRYEGKHRNDRTKNYRNAKARHRARIRRAMAKASRRANR